MKGSSRCLFTYGSIPGGIGEEYLEQDESDVVFVIVREVIGRIDRHISVSIHVLNQIEGHRHADDAFRIIIDVLEIESDERGDFGRTVRLHLHVHHVDRRANITRPIRAVLIEGHVEVKRGHAANRRRIRAASNGEAERIGIQ